MTTVRFLFSLVSAVVSRAQTSAVSLADTQQRTPTSAKIRAAKIVQAEDGIGVTCGALERSLLEAS
jgi:hypothetical protein